MRYFAPTLLVLAGAGLITGIGWVIYLETKPRLAAWRLRRGRRAR